MSKILINKEQITRVQIFKEKSYDDYVFIPENICYFPFTKFVMQHTGEHWDRKNEKYRNYYSSINIKNDDSFIVKNNKLYKKPFIHIRMSSGYGSDVVKYFDTMSELNKWVEKNLSGVELIKV